MVRERRERFRPTFSGQLTLGIVLCVVGVLPLFLALRGLTPLQVLKKMSPAIAVALFTKSSAF